MALLAVGEKAPYFEGVNQAGEKISLNDFQGKKLILYFYPKDDTPGCTAEACNLNDNYEMWIGKGYQVVDVSPDSQASHQKFISKYGLKFNLLSDESKTILNAYGAWGEKKNYGKTYMGVIRSTYIIDEEGRIVEVIGTVDTKNHTGQIMKKLNL